MKKTFGLSGIIMVLLTILTASHTYAQPKSTHDSISDLATISFHLSQNVRILESMKYLSVAYDMSARIGDSSKLGLIFLCFAENYQNMNVGEEANAYYEKAADMFRENGMESNYNFTQYCRANNYEVQYEYSNNKDYLEKAFSIIMGIEPNDSINNRQKAVRSLIISRILTEYSALHNNDQYSREALTIVTNGEKFIKGNNLENEFKYNYMFNKLSTLANLDSLDECQKIVDGIEIDSLNAIQQTRYFPVLIKYYKKKQDYEMALKFQELNRKKHYQFFNLDDLSETHKHRAQVLYNQFVKEKDQEIYRKESLYQTQSENRRAVNICLAFTIFIMLVIMSILGITKNYLQEQEIMLNHAKKENEEKNNELLSIHSTIEQQKQELLNQYHTKQAQIQNSRIFGQRMKEAMRLAKSIQDALMPSPAMMSSALKQHFIYWKPVAPVSGDFYWMKQAGNCTYMLAGDCTGHSVPGALLSMLGISILNDLSSSNDMLSEEMNPGILLDKMKSQFTQSLHISKNHIDDSIELALIKIDPKKSQIQYAGANRPMLMVRDNDAIEFKPTKMCIGYNVIERNNFVNNIIDYEPEDMIYIYTDGLSDQFGGIDGHTKFGTKRFIELLSNISDLPTKIQQSIIFANMYNWMNIEPYNIAADQIDDQLIIGIRV